jgi:hypothetical protein
VPASTIELIGNTTLPVLLILTSLAVLVALRATLPKLSAVGDMEKMDLTPIPVTVTYLVPALPPAATPRSAIFGPVVVGLKRIVIHSTDNREMLVQIQQWLPTSTFPCSGEAA